MAGVNRRSHTAVRALRRLSIEEARASTITLNPKWTGAFTRSNNRRLCFHSSFTPPDKEEKLALLPMLVSLFINLHHHSRSDCCH